MRKHLTFALVALSFSFSTMAQRGLDIAQHIVDKFGNPKATQPLLARGQHSSGTPTMVTEALKYQIDSIIEHEKFDQAMPYEPLRAYGYSFSGFSNELRVTEERIYEYNPAANDFSGQRSRRVLIYDTNNQLITERLDLRDGNNWVEQERYDITYTSGGRLQTVKNYFNGNFSFGDSITYRFNSNDLLDTLNLYSNFGGNWELGLRATGLTYQNGKERSVTLEVDAMGTGSVAPFFQFVDLEWDLGYFPVINDLVSFTLPSYTARILGNTSLEIPSNAKIQINLFTWIDFQKIGTISQAGNNYRLYAAEGSGPGSPLNDTTFFNILVDGQNRIISLVSEVADPSGIGTMPFEKDSLSFDNQNNETLYENSTYNDNNQQYEVFYAEKRNISYDPNWMLTEVELIIEDGFDEYRKFEIFGGQIASILNFDKQSIRVFPNPAENHVSIETELRGETPFSILASDGKIVQTGKIVNNQIQLVDFPKGIYILRVDNKYNVRLIRK